MAHFKRILHIASGVTVQSLYKNIFKELSKRSLIQSVFVPTNSKSKIGRNSITSHHITYGYSVVDSTWKKILFFPKVDKHFGNLDKAVDISKHTYCFAYTLMTDGAVAYRIKMKYGIPYSVFVRNTDINFYYRYFFWLRPLFKRILFEAEYINFPNPSYRDRTLALFRKSEVNKIDYKIRIVPNGIDRFWHDNRIKDPKEKPTEPIQLIFVGRIDKNKNVDTTIKALKLLNKHASYQLTLIGPIAKRKIGDIRRWISELDGTIKYLGQIDDKMQLLHYYRNADIFVMPSFTETFGLVYVEAMTQGLPIIYTEGEGISGYFRNLHVGLGVSNPSNEYEIASKIAAVSDNYCRFSRSAVEQSLKFDWTTIISEFLDQLDKENEK